MDDFFKSLKRHRPFLAAFIASIVLLFFNLLFQDYKTLLTSYAALISLFLAVIYELVNLIDKRFIETAYIENINSIYPENFSNLLQKSKNIDLLGIHLNSFLKNYKNDIETALVAKAKIRFVIVPRNSNAVNMTALRYNSENTKVSINNENGRIDDTHVIIQTWQKKYPKQVELKETDYLFEHELIILDKMAIDTRYNFGTKSSNNKPKFFYKKNSEWYEFCTQEFNNHWSMAENVAFNK